MTNEKKKKIKKIFFFFFCFFLFFAKVRGPWGVFTRFQFSVAVCQTALGCSCSRYCFAAYFGVLRPQASIGPVFGGCCFCQRRPPLFVVVVRFALGVSCVVGYSKRTPRFYPVRFFFLLFYDSVFAFPPRCGHMCGFRRRPTLATECCWRRFSRRLFMCSGCGRSCLLFYKWKKENGDYHGASRPAGTASSWRQS